MNLPAAAAFVWGWQKNIFPSRNISHCIASETWVEYTPVTRSSIAPQSVRVLLPDKLTFAFPVSLLVQEAELILNAANEMGQEKWFLRRLSRRQLRFPVVAEKILR